MKHLVYQPHAILSVENPKYEGREKISHENALSLLNQAGQNNAVPMQGHYGAPERSILISNPTEEQLNLVRKIAHSTGQESHIESDGQNHKMLYSNGPEAGKAVTGSGTTFHETAPEDYYSVLPDGSTFTHNFDFDKTEDLNKDMMWSQGNYRLNRSELQKAREEAHMPPEQKRSVRQERQKFSQDPLESKVTTKPGVSVAGIEARRADPRVKGTIAHGYIRAASPAEHKEKAKRYSVETYRKLKAQPKANLPINKSDSDGPKPLPLPDFFHSHQGLIPKDHPDYSKAVAHIGKEYKNNKQESNRLYDRYIGGGGKYVKQPMEKNFLKKADKLDRFGLSTNTGRRIQYGNLKGVNRPTSMNPNDGISGQGYTVRGAMATISPEGNRGQKFRQPEGGPNYDRELARDKAKKVLSELKNMPKPNLPFNKSELSKGLKGDWKKEGYKIVSNEPDDKGIFTVSALKNKKIVGQAYIKDHGTHIKPYSPDPAMEAIDIDPEHRRKGLATAMYRHAEQKVGKKMHRDSLQSREAKALWAQPNRPFGKSELSKGLKGDWKKEGYKISHEHYQDDGAGEAKTHVRVMAHDKSGNLAGNARFQVGDKGLNPVGTAVGPEHQRKGLANAMYAHAEKVTGKKATPSDKRTDESKALWSQPNRPFGKSDKIPGGLAEGKKPSDFPKLKLRQGKKVEMEHTSDPGIAQEIAMDHLTEDPKYYEKLKTIEKPKVKKMETGIIGTVMRSEPLTKANKPLTIAVHHGTSWRDSKFNAPSTKKGQWKANFFTTKERHAQNYAHSSASNTSGDPVVLHGTLTLKNPYHIGDTEIHKVGKMYENGTVHNFYKEVKDKGHDGIVFPSYDRATEYLSFKDNAFKPSHHSTWDGSRFKKIKKSEPLMKPYTSEAQRRWAHTPAGTKALGGKEAVKHWDKETKGKKLPEKVEKAKVYHGTYNDFKPEELRPSRGGHYGPGYYVSARKIDVRNYGDKIHEYDVDPNLFDLTNPQHVSDFANKNGLDLSGSKVPDYFDIKSALRDKFRNENLIGTDADKKLHSLLRDHGYTGIKFRHNNSDQNMVLFDRPTTVNEIKARKKLGKSNYGPRFMDLYSHSDNQRRKQSRTGETLSVGPNAAVRQAGPTKNQQAEAQARIDKEKSRKNPVKVFSPQERRELASKRGLLAASEMVKTSTRKKQEAPDQRKLKPLLKPMDKAAAPKVNLNPEHGKTIANAYGNMKHDPNNPQVKAAYGALINETKQQYQNLLNQGFKFTKVTDPSKYPYKNSKEMHHDIEHNKHLYYFPTSMGFGSEGEAPKDHPMLKPTEFKSHDGETMLANDILRQVHDVNGHFHGGKTTFSPKGEHQSYIHHKKMYSSAAQPALANELIMQNSWVNFGPHGEHNRKNPSQTIYAPQKAGLAPEWVWKGKWHGEA